jgi:2-dehydropantoate 2-reductase
VNVYIVGAGAIGTWFGEQLRAIGCEVTYAPRDLAAVQNVAAELAVVAVKSFDTASAVSTLQRALGSEQQTTILSLQNGIGNEALLAAAFGADRIVAGALTVPVERLADGSVAGANRGGIGMAPFGRQAHNWLIAAFGQLGVPVVVAPSAASLKWSKLALNCLANASCAILDLTPAEVVAQPKLFDLELRGLREVRAVMRGLDVAAIDLPRYPVRSLFAAASLPSTLARGILASRIAGARGQKAPSLLLDLRSGKSRSEVTVLNGAVVEQGLRLGLKTPVNAAFTRILSDIAEHPAHWERYSKRPEELLAAVNT